MRYDTEGIIQRWERLASQAFVGTAKAIVLLMLMILMLVLEFSLALNNFEMLIRKS